MFIQWSRLATKQYEMSVFLRSAAVLHCLFLIAAQRPKFRLDYKYEKAFKSFYKLHHGATSWYDARLRCQAEGSELLVPASLDEADTLPILITSILTRFEGIFLGVHDLYSERSFVSIHGNSIMNTILNLLWEYEEPRHSGGRCVAMRRTGRMFAHPCHEPLPFMCKVATNDIQYYDECHSFDPRWKLGFDDTCYFMQVEPQTWFQGYATCLAAGGYLAIINNQKEADHIKNMFKQTDARRIPNNDFAFLGFSDLFQRHHYRTVHDERMEDLNYRDWEQQHCLKMGINGSKSDLRCGGIRRTGLLSAWDCEIPAMFFCEKPANGTYSKSKLHNDPRNADSKTTTQSSTVPSTVPTTKTSVPADQPDY